MSSSTTALFIGPSAPRSVVDAHFDGQVLPPIGRGDLDALVARGGVDAVGIVDGAFFQRLAVTPKEVLRALDAGVRVYGSSSMGALRAAECHPFGMVGVGVIFELYASGQVDADDEVAITYDPETLVAVSEPMVNIRLALAWAAQQNLVSNRAAEVATATAKALYFPERTYQRLVYDTAPLLPAAEHEQLRTFLRSGRVPDQKRADAVELLNLLNAS